MKFSEYDSIWALNVSTRIANDANAKCSTVQAVLRADYRQQPLWQIGFSIIQRDYAVARSENVSCNCAREVGY